MPGESAEVCALLRSSNAANELRKKRVGLKGVDAPHYPTRGPSHHARRRVAQDRCSPTRLAVPLLRRVAMRSANGTKSLLRGAFAPQTQSLCARNDFTLVTGTPSASSRSICHFLMRFSPADGHGPLVSQLEVG